MKNIGSQYVMREENISPEIKGENISNSPSKYSLSTKIFNKIKGYAEDPENFLEIRKNFRRSIDKNPDSFLMGIDKRLNSINDVSRLQKALDYINENRYIQGIKEVRK